MTRSPPLTRAPSLVSSRLARCYFLTLVCSDYRGLKKRITAVRRAQEGQLALEAATAAQVPARARTAPAAAGDNKTNIGAGASDVEATDAGSLMSAASERPSPVQGEGAGRFRDARTPSPPLGLYGLEEREGDRDPSPLRSSAVASSGSADGRPALLGGGRRRGGSVRFLSLLLGFLPACLSSQFTMCADCVCTPTGR